MQWFLGNSSNNQTIARLGSQAPWVGWSSNFTNQKHSTNTPQAPKQIEEVSSTTIVILLVAFLFKGLKKNTWKVISFKKGRHPQLLTSS
ncbi:hypothetical protein A3843_03790 [Pseudovibrio exalbescens]|uniref:Uncharacterized protein n=1 Tax=Pseudovibrio exalbescens TaxID=197461 RepID=A0A1U7JL36_9HYPH|nr:hypothetical protein A3843_03790 [Pseudovibrio exalbescens]